MRHVPAAVPAWPSFARLGLSQRKRSHPDWWIPTIAGAAWAVLLIGFARAGVRSPLTDRTTSIVTDTWPGAIGSLVAMTVAMMSPLARPTVRHAALASLWTRRTRSVVVCLGGYLVVWIAAAVVMTLVIQAASGLGIVPVQVAAAGAAIAWQFTATKRRQLRRCAQTIPLAPNGWRADYDCARFGALVGSSCVVTCWGYMAVGLTAGHSLPILAGLALVQLHERAQRRYAPVTGAGALAAFGWLVTMPSILRAG